MWRKTKLLQMLMFIVLSIVQSDTWGFKNFILCSLCGEKQSIFNTCLLKFLCFKCRSIRCHRIF